MSGNLRFQTQLLQPQRTGLNHPANTWDLAQGKGGGFGGGPREFQEG